MSLESGILGFLSMKSLSGYDLKRLFDMSASYFWPADQAQIYRTLKKLALDSLVKQKGRSQGLTVDRKIYEITEDGQKALYASISNPTEADFISRLPQIMQLFFSGVLSVEEQLDLLDKQLRLNDALIEKLKNNYEENGDLFAEIVGLTDSDRRLDSAIYACRWGVLRGEAYGKLLEEIKEDILRKSNLK